MMRSLLHSRIDTGFLSNQRIEDEDVNVYLAHLLQALGDTAFLAEARPYLHKYDHEVFECVSGSQNPRVKYEVYKTNADFLLVSLGIFDNPSQILMDPLPGNHSYSRHREWAPQADAVMARGRTYYKFAHSYGQLVHQRNSGINDVLHKLSGGFDQYVRLLAHLRGEYLDLVQELSRGEMYHLERSLNQKQEEDIFSTVQDAFLDAYADYRRDRTPAKRTALEQAAREVQQRDPHFTFDIDRLAEGNRES